MKSFIAILILICIFSASCTNNSKYRYAIKDFRKDIQPQLTQVVTNGYARRYQIFKNVTDEELRKLGICEHPVIRASAVLEMLKRESFNHFNVVMEHLDDTAVIATDAGEFGIIPKMVSDFIIQNTLWRSISSRNKTVDEVLANHSYLTEAYAILPLLNAPEKHYSVIKAMALKEVESYDEFEKVKFKDVEKALYCLASFKKLKDKPIIRQRLQANLYRLSERSFDLMRDFPDTAYQSLFEVYYPSAYYYNLDRTHYEGAVAFIDAVASYKNERSVTILSSMLDPFIQKCILVDTGSVRDAVRYAIWNNPCLSYKTLRKRVSPYMSKWLGSNRRQLQVEKAIVDTTRETIWWLERIE